MEFSLSLEFHVCYNTVLADNEWQRFRGQAVIHSYKQLCFCGAHENSCLGQWSHFVDLYPILKNLEFTLLIWKYLFMNYTKVWLHYYNTMYVLKYAEILRDDKVIYLPPFHWVVLHTPWCVHNPLWISGFRNNLHIFQINYLSPSPHSWVKYAFPMKHRSC